MKFNGVESAMLATDVTYMEITGGPSKTARPPNPRAHPGHNK